MGISIEEAIGEVKFFIENGGISAANYEHVASIIQQFGENKSEIFQEAAEQIHTLFAEGVVINNPATVAA